jgi:ABC-type ATPase involved in cell division
MDVVVDFHAVEGEQSIARWEHPVTFQLPRGQLHLVHTTSAHSASLFRLCLGFSAPSVGTVTVSGSTPWTLGRNDVRLFRRSVGCALEPDGLVSNLTLRMNLIIPLVFATGLDFDAASARVDSLLDVMHLAMWSEVRPAALPLEARQAAALARALAPRPSLLLLENPLHSLDNKETRRLMSLCRAQAETLLIASHSDDSVLDEFADRIWIWDEDGLRPRTRPRSAAQQLT